ncbi:hypothetical protein LXA43DRAFT_26434 [Ganoderma leucocontextum]|nr:hypothetical protein LXA43DRAFT_26434 [Ganoderma leucocontextum]
MVNKTGAGGDWSFSLRSNNYHHDTSSSDDGSDSDDQCPQVPSSTTGERTQPSEEARLLGELDLASRTDAASYKPNPWTIAKANAAVRAPMPSAPTKEARQKRRNRAQPTILDLLRAQSKASVITHTPQAQSAGTGPAVPVPTVVSSKHLNPDYLLNDDAHIPSDDTLVDNASEPGVLSKLGDNGSILEPSFSLLSPGGPPPGKAAMLDGGSTPGLPGPDSQVRQSHPEPLSRPSTLVGSHQMQNRISAEAPPPPPDQSSAGRELRAILFNSARPNGPVPKSLQLSHEVSPASRTGAHSLFPGKWHPPSLLVQLASLCSYT